MSDNFPNERDSGHQPATDVAEPVWHPVADRSFECDGDVDLVKEIITTVADAENVEITTITPPLFDVVNVSALEDLFFGHTMRGDSRDCTGKVEFRYRGLRVTVTSECRIVVSAPGDDPE